MSKSPELATLRQGVADRPAVVIEQVHQWLTANGPQPEALRIAAAAHRALGQRPEAHRAEIAAMEASSGDADLKQADHALSRREFTQALRLADKRLRDFPDDLKALVIAAEGLIGLDQADCAVPLLESVLLRAPSYLLARTLLINALSHVDRLADAQTLLRPVLDRLTADAGYCELAGKIASRRGQYVEAVAAYRKLTELTADSPAAWIGLGDNLRYLGQRDDALAAYRQAAALDRSHGLAWWSMADLAADTLTDGDLAEIRQILAEGPPADRAANLEFALGIAEDKRGNFARAFDHFQRGNDARKAFDLYDGPSLARLLDSHLVRLDDVLVTGDLASEQPIPIFIIGMPRSGSTLTERMLGQHTQIEALGELPIIPHMVARLKRDATEDVLVDRTASLSERDRQQMGQYYLARAGEMRRRPEKRFIIDKMHMNWRHLPLILRILPHAKVIDVRRDAMDCCWSNYRTMFAQGHPAALDQQDIVHFYRQYARFVDAIAARFPGAIYRLDYEQLLQDPDGQLADLCTYLGVTPEPAMLAFEHSRDPVATASSEQVRQPLNTRGLNAWRRYEQWLGPMQSALGTAG